MRQLLLTLFVICNCLSVFGQSNNDSLKIWLAAAKNGDAKAQEKVGDYYYGIMDSLHSARQKASKLILATYDKPEMENIAKAAKWYKKAAKQECADAQFKLGICYQSLLGSFSTKCIGWLTKAADNGHLKAMHKLGLDYCVDGDTKNDSTLIKKSFDYFHKAAILGYGPSQYQLGEFYNRKCNYKEAFNWYQKSANQGYPNAMLALGHYYMSGTYIDADTNVAFSFYKQSAEKGNVYAKLETGKCYYHGYGIEKDYEKAFQIFSEVAELRDVSFLFLVIRNGEPQYYLGLCYEQGKGVEKDLNKAKDWYRQSSWVAAKERLKILSKK